MFGGELNTSIWGHEDISWISILLSLNVWYMITGFLYLINRIQRMSLSYFSLEVIVVLE